MSERDLETQRFLLLVRQLAEDPEIRSQHAAAEKIGIHPSYVSKLRSNPERRVGREVIEKARKLTGVSPRFFDNPALGHAPRYEDHRGEAVVEEGEGPPAVEEYISAMEAVGAPVSPSHKRELRDTLRSAGPDSLSPEVVAGMHQGLVARDSRRALERPSIRGRVETERGQRRLPPKKGRG